jgi:hypothetical protein
MDHGGHVGYQEGAREPSRCARQGEDIIQFGIAESDFKSISGTWSIVPSN